MNRAARTCPNPSCPELVAPGEADCPNGCTTARQRQGRRAHDATRPTATQRGYDAAHRRFRRAVLRRDPTCVLCHSAPSTEADHHPHSRRDLVAMGADPNDPRNGRGLCKSCHSAETNRHDGGFGHPTRSVADPGYPH